MDILDILKKFKNIAPHPEYAKNSRRFILHTPKEQFSSPVTFLRAVTQILQAGGTIALAGALLLLIFGGIPAGRFLTPFRISSLNPEGLKAEADAIDIQIQLTDINYQEPELLDSLVNETTTIPTASKKSPYVKARPSGTGAVSSTHEATIEEILRLLSK